MEAAAAAAACFGSSLYSGRSYASDSLQVLSPRIFAQSQRAPRVYPASISVKRVCTLQRRLHSKACFESVETKKQLRSDRKRLAVFVSGGGSNFRSIHKATLDGTAHGDVVIVVSDKPECKACDYAREQQIPVTSYPKGKFSPEGISPKELVDTLRHQQVDYVLLAGYLKLIPKELVEAFPRAILNIHPALLPAFGGKGFYGMKVHQAVIASGARFSGPTIHFVDEKYDEGRILAQRTVHVLPNDTAENLATRVLQQEHALYVEAVAALCEDRIHWRADGVPLIRKSCHSDEFY